MRKTAVFILAILLMFLPFHPFLSTFITSSLQTDNEFVIAAVKAWKEILILLFCVLAFFFWLGDKDRKPFDNLDLSIFLFGGISFLVGILFTGSGFPENMPQIVWGAKYGLLFLFLFFFVRRIHFFETEKNDLINAALLSATVVIFFGILQTTVLPENFLTHFGYSNEYGVTNVPGELSYCHKIENVITHDEFCRIQSTLSGPNQLGAYLLIILPFFFYRMIRSNTNVKMLLYFVPLFFGIIVLFLTWSRSAWIGALVMIATFFVIEARKSLLALLYLVLLGLGISAIFTPAFIPDEWDDLRFISLACAGIALFMMLLVFVANVYHRFFSQAGGFFFPTVLGALIYARAFRGEFFWNIIYRPSSSQGHWERWSDGVRYIIENPLGLGLGDAGPASARFALPGQTGFLPESWYLQVGLESGFLGLALFLTILILLGMKILQIKTDLSKVVFLSLVGVSVAALFLHSWESSVVAITFWTLAGIVLSPQKYSRPLIKRIADKLGKLFLKKT